MAARRGPLRPIRARRGVRAERTRRELSGDGPLQVRHSVRDRLGHTGNFPGYTTIAVSSPDGRRSFVMLVSTQLDKAAGVPATFQFWRRTAEDGVCAALAR